MTVPHSGGGSGAPGPAQLGSERSASGAGGAGGAGGGGERGRAGGGGAGRRHFEDPRSREVTLRLMCKQLYLSEVCFI